MLEIISSRKPNEKRWAIPPLPLNPEETAEVCRFLENPPPGKERRLRGPFQNRVAPGVDPAAKVKAAWLAKVATESRLARRFSERKPSSCWERCSAVIMSIRWSVFLGGPGPGQGGGRRFESIVLVYGAFDTIVELSKRNPWAQDRAQLLGERGVVSHPPASSRNDDSQGLSRWMAKSTPMIFRRPSKPRPGPIFRSTRCLWGETPFPGGIKTIAAVPGRRPQRRLRRRRRRNGLVAQVRLQFR